jgi:hypothetical protein
MALILINVGSYKLKQYPGEAPVNRSLACVVGGLLYATAIAEAQQSSDSAGISVGHDFAIEFCAACHVVASDQRQRPIYRGPSPSFIQIANKPAVTADSLRRFIRTTHPTLVKPLDMPASDVSDYQLDEIIRYILSLRRH